MLAILYGLNGANSKCSCIFCENVLVEDSHTTFNVRETEEIISKYKPIGVTRSILEATRTISNGILPHKGYINEPLIHIDFKNCVFDTLHFILRVSDKLFGVLMYYICTLDGRDHIRSKDFSKRPR